jgi:hypothetical protein
VLTYDKIKLKYIILIHFVEWETCAVLVWTAVTVTDILLSSVLMLYYVNVISQFTLPHNNYQCSHLKTDCRNLQETCNSYKHTSTYEDTNIPQKLTACIYACCIPSCQSVWAYNCSLYYYNQKGKKVEQYIALITLPTSKQPDVKKQPQCSRKQNFCNSNSNRQVLLISLILQNNI